jgi:hypothetical protein
MTTDPGPPHSPLLDGQRGPDALAPPDAAGAMQETDTASDSRPLLEAMLNLTESHREHEKYYSVSPREQAVVLQRHSRTLHALADQWSSAAPSPRQPFSPYEGANDLNADAATQLDGVLFMEGEGEPGEIKRLKRDLREYGTDAAGAGEWLAQAMTSSWAVAAALLDIDGLADLLGERHRIIANNWQAAALTTLAAHVLERAADTLDRVAFSPTSLRADLAGAGVSVHRVYSAAEMIDHAADLLSDFARLVHDNERRWRVVHQRITALLAERGDGRLPGDETAPLERGRVP